MRTRNFGAFALLVAGTIGFYLTGSGAGLAAGRDVNGGGKPVTVPAPAAPPVDGAHGYGAKPAVPATGYFPILPFNADPDLAPQLLPVASNHPLGGDHAHATRAIVIIHDATRDASGDLAALMALAGPANDTMFIAAPQFLLESDIARFAGHLPREGRDFARWAIDAWRDGGDSAAAAPQKGISSFTALDLLLVYLGDKQFFPALKSIVVAGHGAGGDFVLRYAAMGQAPDLLAAQGVSVRFAAADASSYLYFTPLRPLAGKPGFDTPGHAKCPGYDAYPYGLGDLNPYARRIGANAIRLGYPSRHVTYLIGETAGADDAFPDRSCAALLEGPDRFARARNYNIYLGTIFGDAAAKTQGFAVVPKIGDDIVDLFGSACGMETLFGDGACAAPAVTGAETPQ